MTTPRVKVNDDPAITGNFKELVKAKSGRLCNSAIQKILLFHQPVCA